MIYLLALTLPKMRTDILSLYFLPIIEQKAYLIIHKII